MSVPTMKENRNGDRRWLVLMLVLLVIVVCAPLSRFPAEIRAWRRSDAQPQVPSWGEFDWRWRKQGAEGEGLYPEPGGKAIPGSVAAARPTVVDPRLAIFTYRPIDLNLADPEVLQSVKGIGPKLAGAIVGYRLSHGPFHSLDELLNIRGVGPAKLAKLRGQLRVGKRPE